MKNSIAKLQEQFAKIYQFMIRYRVTLFIIFASITLSVMLADISRMSDASPSQVQISEAEQSVKIVRFKESSITVIKSLKENNITIDTLFDPNRYDPFNN